MKLMLYNLNTKYIFSFSEKCLHIVCYFCKGGCYDSTCPGINGGNNEITNL
jgi:hypothetical protein